MAFRGAGVPGAQYSIIAPGLGWMKVTVPSFHDLAVVEAVERLPVAPIR